MNEWSTRLRAILALAIAMTLWFLAAPPVRAADFDDNIGDIVEGWTNNNAGPRQPMRDDGHESCEWSHDAMVVCEGFKGFENLAAQYWYIRSYDVACCAQFFTTPTAAPTVDNNGYPLGYPRENNLRWGIFQLGKNVDPGETMRLTRTPTDGRNVEPNPGIFMGGVTNNQRVVAPNNYCGWATIRAGCVEALSTEKSYPNFPQNLLDIDSDFECSWQDASQINCAYWIVREDGRIVESGKSEHGVTWRSHVEDNLKYYYDPAVSAGTVGVFRSSNPRYGVLLFPNVTTSRSNLYILGAPGPYQEMNQKPVGGGSDIGAGVPIITDRCYWNMPNKEGCRYGFTPATGDGVYQSATDNVVAPVEPVGAISGGGTGPAAGEEECALEAGAFAWVLCPIIRVANAGFTKMTEAAVGLLQIDVLADSDSAAGLQAIWGVMRNLANIGFVIIFLVIIFSNVLSINLDSYTVKRMLPRLVAATIFVQFSFLICGLVVDFANVLGGGLDALIDTAVGNAIPSYQSSGGNPALGLQALGVVLAGAMVFVSGLLPFILALALTGLISILGLFITLLLRQLVIAILIVMAPIAFAAWVLPNTDSLFRFWWKNFFKTVMMYPLIVLIVAMGRILAAIVNTGAQANTPSQFVAAVFPVIAFLMIPATFKMVGGITGAVAGKIKGGSDKAGKFAGGKVRDSQWAKDQQLNALGRRAGLGSGVTRLSRRLEGAGAGRSGLRGLATRGAGRLAGKGLRGAVGAGSLGTIPTSEGAIGRAQNKVFDDQFKDAQLAVEGRVASGELGRAALRAMAVDPRQSAAMRSAAIETMAKHGDYRGLHSVKEAVMASKDGKRVWSTGVKSQYGDIAQKAGYLHSVGATADERVNNFLESMTADQLANLGAGGVDDATVGPDADTVAGVLSATTLTTAARDRLRTVAGEVHANDNRRGRVHTRVAGEVLTETGVNPGS